MSALQKCAWFHLAVIGLTLATVIGLFPFLGKAALGGLGWLGLIGFTPVLFRKKPGQVLTDERDQLIHQRSWIVAYALFWVAFVLSAVLLSPLVYGQEGAVPVWVVQISVSCGFMLVYALASFATLIQYAQGSGDGK